MPSIVGKRRGNQTYYYLVESARVDGKPRIVSQQYLGSAEEVTAKLAGQAGQPVRSQHKRFGDVAAVWSMLDGLDVVGLVDDVLPRYANAGASVGTYLALATLNRVVDPRSKRAFADWWATTAAPRWVKVDAAALDHRRFWDAMDLLSTEDLRAIETSVYGGMIDRYGLDLASVALDMTNFATYIDSTNDRLPVEGVDSLTVVYDAGQNSATNHEQVEAAGIGFVGSLPPSDHPDLLDIARSRYRTVDPDRFPGLTYVDTTVTALGVTRRAVLTHSKTLHAAQSRGFDQTLAKAQQRLAALGDKLARGKTRRPRTAVEAEIAAICKPRWVAEVLTTTLTGDKPADLRLSFTIDTAARKKLEARLFGKRILFTNRDTWPVAEVVAAYRSQSGVEFGFRQLKDGPPGMSVGHSVRILSRSWGRWMVMGPQESMTRARAASGLWKPRARRKMRRTTLLSPSARPLLMFNRIAASRPSRNLRIVLAALTNAGRRERLAREIHRSISSATWAALRSPAKMARNASFNV